MEKMYVAPELEVLEVMVECGFEGSGSFDISEEDNDFGGIGL